MRYQVNNPHLDASESIFFTRELESVRAKAYDTKFAMFKARLFIPVTNEDDPGAETIVYEQYTEVGMAKIITNYASDLPRADVKGKEFRSPVRSIGDSYGYSLQEIRAAALAKKPLEVRKANAARRGIEQEIERIARTGDSANGLLGMLNQPNATAYTILNGVSGHPDWARKTPDEIIRDLGGIVTTIVTTTKEVEIPDTILLPTTQYNYIATTRMGDGSDVTILKFFLGSNPYIKNIFPWQALDTAGSGSTTRMVAYRRDPDALQLVIPQEFEQLAPQQENLTTVIPCHARIGGVILYYPLSMAYGDGI